MCSWIRETTAFICEWLIEQRVREYYLVTTGLVIFWSLGTPQTNDWWRVHGTVGQHCMPHPPNTQHTHRDSHTHTDTLTHSHTHTHTSTTVSLCVCYVSLAVCVWVADYCGKKNGHCPTTHIAMQYLLRILGECSVCVCVFFCECL